MRGGKLDRSLTIQRGAHTVDQYGVPSFTWSDIATVRAQIVQQTTEEFIRGYGAADETIIIFHIRWLDGVQLADRILFEGRIHNLKEIKEIGRRRDLELRSIEERG